MSAQIEKIRSIISEVTGTDDILIEVELADQGVSSVNMMMVLGNLENEFDIEIPEEDLVSENFKNIKSINNVITKNQ